MSIATLINPNKNDVYCDQLICNEIILNSIPMTFYSQNIPSLQLYQSVPFVNLNISVNAYFYRFGSLAVLSFDLFTIPTGTMSALSPLDLYGLDPIAQTSSSIHFSCIYVKVAGPDDRLIYDHQITNSSIMRLRNTPTEFFDNTANDLIFLKHTISYIM